MVERELALSGEVLAEKYKDRLESSYRVIYLLIYDLCCMFAYFLGFYLHSYMHYF